MMSSDVPVATPVVPAFLVGAERSGTTMLRLMLDHHPAITWFGELEFLVDKLPAEGWPATESYLQELALDRKFAASAFRADPALSYPELMASFAGQIRERFGKPVVGTTVHLHFDRLPRIWPQARFVHLLRDGRDVARSRISMGWHGNAWTAATGWIDAESAWDALRAIVPAERVLEVRFEDLVRDPEAQLTRICRFLGVGFDAAMLDYSRDSSYERPDAALAESWRRKMSASEIALAEARLGGLLAARGYPPSGVAPARVSRLRAVGLRLQDRWFRMRFRMRRYGAGLWLADLAARRLPIASWHESVQRRVNDIDAKHLR